MDDSKQHSWARTGCSLLAPMRWRCQEKKNREAAEKSLKRKCSAEEVTRSAEKQGADAVKKCKETGYNLTRGQTLHKLPFQVLRTASMELVEAKAKLCWITGVVAVKGYSASKVEIVNRKTGRTEIVKLINCDPDDFLGPGETEVSSNKYICCPQSPPPSIPLSLGSGGKHM